MEYNPRPILMDDIDGFVAVGMQAGLQESPKGIASFCDEERRYAIVAEHLYEIRVNAENQAAIMKVTSSTSLAATEGSAYEVAGPEPTLPLPRKHDFDFLMDLGNDRAQAVKNMREPVPLAHRRSKSEGLIRRALLPKDIDGLMAVGDPLVANARSSSMPLTERCNNGFFDDTGEKGRDYYSSTGCLDQKPPGIAYTIRIGKGVDENCQIMNLSLGALIPPDKVLPDIDGFIALATTTKPTPKSRKSSIMKSYRPSSKTDEKNKSEPSLRSSARSVDSDPEVNGSSKSVLGKPVTRRTTRPRSHTDAPRPSASLLQPREILDIDSLLLVGVSGNESLRSVLPLPKPLDMNVPGRNVPEQPDLIVVGGSAQPRYTPITTNVLDIDEMMQLASKRSPIST